MSLVLLATMGTVRAEALVLREQSLELRTEAWSVRAERDG